MLRWQAFPWTVHFFLLGFISLFLAWRTLRGRTTPLQRSTAALFLANAIWVLGKAGSYLLADPHAAINAFLFSIFGLIAAVPAVACMALCYAGQENRLQPTRVVVVSMLYFAYACQHLLKTDPLRIYDAIEFRPQGDVNVIWAVQTPLGEWMMWLAQIPVLIGLGALAHRWTRLEPLARIQAAGLLVTIFVPWAGFYLQAAFNVPVVESLGLPAVLSNLALIAWYFLQRWVPRLALTPIAREVVFEGMRDAIVVTDPRGLILDLNPAARQILPTRDLLGRAFDAQWAASWSGPPLEWENGFQGEYGRPSESTAGEQFAQLRITQLLHRSQPSGWVLTIQDVTRAKLAARELIEARQAAERAAAAKSEFLAMMSHEIRTPMNGVLGTAHLLEDSALNAEQARHVHTILQSGRALMAILNDVLDMAKLEAGRFELDRIAFSWPEIAGQTIALFGAQAAAKGVTLHHEMLDPVPELLEGDPQRLGQVLANLVGNAVKFTDAGTIRVTATYDAQFGLEVLVADTGPGIPPDRQADLFEQFSQVDTSSQRRYGGTGLGLAISRRLIQLMNGEIGVESEWGAGSTFWFRVPLAAPAGRLPVPETPADTTSFDAAVLLVEDNPVNQRVAAGLLRKLGCRVVIAGDGEEALRLSQSQPPDLILMDCFMPVMDGYTAAQRLRARGDRTPIVALTASVTPRDRERCTQSGMDDFLSKPIQPLELRRVLSRWSRAETSAA